LLEVVFAAAAKLDASHLDPPLGLVRFRSRHSGIEAARRSNR
jgi:hypothetical protein